MQTDFSEALLLQSTTFTSGRISTLRASAPPADVLKVLSKLEDTNSKLISVNTQSESTRSLSDLTQKTLIEYNDTREQLLQISSTFQDGVLTDVAKNINRIKGEYLALISSRLGEGVKVCEINFGDAGPKSCVDRICSNTGLGGYSSALPLTITVHRTEGEPQELHLTRAEDFLKYFPELARHRSSEPKSSIEQILRSTQGIVWDTGSAFSFLAAKDSAAALQIKEDHLSAGIIQSLVNQFLFCGLQHTSAFERHESATLESRQANDQLHNLTSQPEIRGLIRLRNYLVSAIEFWESGAKMEVKRILPPLATRGEYCLVVNDQRVLQLGDESEVSYLHSNTKMEALKRNSEMPTHNRPDLNLGIEHNVLDVGDFVTESGLKLLGDMAVQASLLYDRVRRAYVIFPNEANKILIDEIKSKDGIAGVIIDVPSRTWGQAALLALGPDEVKEGAILGSGKAYTAYFFGEVVICESNQEDDGTFVLSKDAFENLRHEKRLKLKQEKPSGFICWIQHAGNEEQCQARWLVRVKAQIAGVTH